MGVVVNISTHVASFALDDHLAQDRVQAGVNLIVYRHLLYTLLIFLVGQSVVLNFNWDILFILVECPFSYGIYFLFKFFLLLHFVIVNSLFFVSSEIFVGPVHGRLIVGEKDGREDRSRHVKK